MLDLMWMGSAKDIHKGFNDIRVAVPESVLDKYLSILVSHGLKVAVIEQTESKLDLKER